MIVLGCGMQGRAAAEDLCRSGHEVTVLDLDRDNLRRLRKKKNIKTLAFDVTDRKKLIPLIADHDTVLGALPAALGLYSMECALEAGVDIADMSYSGADPFMLDRAAKKAKVRIVPDAGFAPGLSNILAGEAYRELGRADLIKIMVGGMPQNPEPPFNYRITWSPQDLVAEYTRPARLFRNFRVVTVKALTGIEEFVVPGIGRLECFYTDGLRTLLRTFRRVRNMEEKTIRYPGHADIFREFIGRGFMSERPFRRTDPAVTPRAVALEYLRIVLSRGDEKDVSVLIVEVRSGRRRTGYLCIDRFDERKKMTSMARMTGFTGSIIAQCIKSYPGYGVIAPELLGINKGTCDYIRKELKKRGIRITGKKPPRCLSAKRDYRPGRRVSS
jgi:saccharopine dehydrogenase-like NADP-dependent oxidoreductase